MKGTSGKITSLKETISLCVEQYRLILKDWRMHRSHCTFHTRKLLALGQMGYTGLFSPKHGCFLCRYVKERGIDPGYSIIKIAPKKKWYWPFASKPLQNKFMKCASHCPMTGILWDHRGCALDPNSVYLRAENGDIDAVYTMLVNFAKLEVRQ